MKNVPTKKNKKHRNKVSKPLGPIPVVWKSTGVGQANLLPHSLRSGRKRQEKKHWNKCLWPIPTLFKAILVV